MRRAAAVLLIALAGCSRQPAEAPRSALPREVAMRSARAVAELTDGRVCAIAATGSMRPTFDDAAVLVTQPARVADIGVGDIVVRRDGNRLIVHRVIGTDEGGLITRGDANSWDDAGRVTDDLIDGRVIAIIYGAGR